MQAFPDLLSSCGRCLAVHTPQKNVDIISHGSARRSGVYVRFAMHSDVNRRSFALTARRAVTL